MIGSAFSPTTDVTSRNPDSSPCLTKCPIEQSLRTNLEGHKIYAHPENKDIIPLLEHYLECKTASPETTSGMFILPAKNGISGKWLKYLTGMELIKTYSGKDRPLRKGPEGTRPYSPQIEVWYDVPGMFHPDHHTRLLFALSCKVPGMFHPDHHTLQSANRSLV